MASSTKSQNLNVRVSDKERDAFYKTCKKNEHVPSDILRRLMKDYTEGLIQYTNRPVQYEG